jgi:hypothetical protein
MLIYKITNNNKKVTLYQEHLNMPAIGKYIDIFGTAEVGDTFTIELVDVSDDYDTNTIPFEDSKEYKEWVDR